MSTASSALLTAWAELLLDGLARAGVRDVVASPGSRSTPFLAAALGTRGLRCHLVVDERAAGFFALGLAKASGAPPLLLCTSGTAGAHYLPAVVEAERTGTPLVVLTADRPFELQGCGAPQTIDQLRLFGEHAVAFVELGMPDGETGALQALRRRAVQAVTSARWPRPGAVHVNARARKPLEPAGDGDPELAMLRARIARLPEPPRILPPRQLPDEHGVRELVDRMTRAERCLVVCGPAPVGQARARAAIRALAARAGCPLLAEATSQVRFGEAPPEELMLVDAFDAILHGPRARAALAPDLVVQIGAPPTSSAWERFLVEHPGCARVVVAPRADCDPASSAALLVLGEVEATVHALLARGPGRAAGAWAARWREANRAAWRAVDALAGADGALGEGEAVRAVVSGLPPGALLAVGNSLPIREVDSFAPAGAADCVVWSQRGANGIDGLVAGAAGAAQVGRPTTLLLGDVSFLHDVGGLQAAGGAPLVVVVLNNGGGRIFEQLPVAASPRLAGSIAHWTTPHDLDLAHAAALYGHGFQRAESRTALAAALAKAHGGRSCTVIEARVPAGSATRFYGQLGARVDEEVG